MLEYSRRSDIGFMYLTTSIISDIIPDNIYIGRFGGVLLRVIHIMLVNSARYHLAVCNDDTVGKYSLGEK